jgi:hypothetical protein
MLFCVTHKISGYRQTKKEEGALLIAAISDNICAFTGRRGMTSMETGMVVLLFAPRVLLVAREANILPVDDKDDDHAARPPLVITEHHTPPSKTTSILDISKSALPFAHQEWNCST